MFGAKKDVGEELVQKLRIQYPDINVLGYTDGYTSDKDLVMQEITQLRPDVLLVALGIPYQELLIQRYYEKFEKGILIGVGGSFDVLSGKKEKGT
ncbi:MAG: WecB/TagA/CpsF family glycosyltransferase [[Ruminococcus] torques]